MQVELIYFINVQKLLLTFYPMLLVYLSQKLK